VQLAGTTHTEDAMVASIVNFYMATFPILHLVTGRFVRGRRMFNSLMMLAVEANGVVALRMMKLMRGGSIARREAKLMKR
jgi:hypothetical protein